MTFDWLTVHEGAAPLIIGLPHTGTTIPAAIEARMSSPWLARKDADWWVDRLYDFARDMGATTVCTALSRSVIDVNRDPSGASLYPGQITTGLCPLETFDGEPLYRPGQAPDAAEIEERRAAWFDPYHAALQAQIDRLQAKGPLVVYAGASQAQNWKLSVLTNAVELQAAHPDDPSGHRPLWRESIRGSTTRIDKM
ncbi:MAG: N-formylglutamate amidohydrolase, partial [Pseudomonadota bacterium]|nr:N-formylglutamate amidohydrolase [Pseudomonadota bacterium]